MFGKSSTFPIKLTQNILRSINQITKITKDIEWLIAGQEFSGEFKGVFYNISVAWDEGWGAEVDLIKFSPMPSSGDVCFWLENLQKEIVEEILYEKIYSLPEVIDFQKRIDSMREVNQDILRGIIDALEEEGRI